MKRTRSGLAVGFTSAWLLAVPALAAGDDRGGGLGPEAGAMTSPSCVGTLTWSGPGDEVPFCPSYSVAQNFAADNCEFYVDAFAQSGFSADGATENWIEAHIQVGSPQGTVVGVGMYTHVIDQDGDGQDLWDFATEIAPATWDTGHLYAQSGIGGTLTSTVAYTAFFIDVRQADDDVTRLWVSNGGANYTLVQIFAAGQTQQTEGDSWYDWANDPSPIFDQKHACGH